MRKEPFPFVKTFGYVIYHSFAVNKGVLVRAKINTEVFHPPLSSTLDVSEETEVALREAHWMSIELRTPTELYSFANYTANMKQDETYVRIREE